MSKKDTCHIWNLITQRYIYKPPLQTCLLRLGCKAVAINFLAIFNQMQESKTCGENYIDVVFRPIAHNCPTGKNVTIRVSVFVFLTPETSILLESSPGKTFASSLDWLIKWSSLGFSLRYYAQETRYWLGSYFRNVTSKILNKDAICCLEDVNFFFPVMPEFKSQPRSRFPIKL